jgi:hypothetical protein
VVDVATLGLKVDGSGAIQGIGDVAAKLFGLEGKAKATTKAMAAGFAVVGTAAVGVVAGYVALADSMSLLQARIANAIGPSQDLTSVQNALFAAAQRNRASLEELSDLYAKLSINAGELGASILIPRYSRYVIDLNRPPDGGALYPGRAETGLCPTIAFSGDPIYRAGHAPEAAEIERRYDHSRHPSPLMNKEA